MLRSRGEPDDRELNDEFPKSSYMQNYNANRFRTFDPKIDNPKFTGTTRELFKGTSKATEQLPGYCGHIPVNTANIIKHEHSYGLKPRPATCDLRLVSERLGSVPGYTGA
jgi:hypothetical protein